MTGFDDRDGLIWFDGEWVDWREAKVHVLTHTLHYGMGVFEGVRAYQTENGTAIFRLEEHTNRLFNSAKIMNMDIGYSKDEINQAQRQAVTKNHLSSHFFSIPYRVRMHGAMNELPTLNIFHQSPLIF
jgi:branched-chain amino acid aminotransferase